MGLKHREMRTAGEKCWLKGYELEGGLGTAQARWLYSSWGRALGEQHSRASSLPTMKL